MHREVVLLSSLLGFVVCCFGQRSQRHLNLEYVDVFGWCDFPCWREISTVLIGRFFSHLYRSVFREEEWLRLIVFMKWFATNLSM